MSDNTWLNRTWLLAVQLMACCLAAPSHWLNQCSQEMWVWNLMILDCNCILKDLWVEVTEWSHYDVVDYFPNPHGFPVMKWYRGYPAKRALSAMRIGPFWQDTIDTYFVCSICVLYVYTVMITLQGSIGYQHIALGVFYTWFNHLCTYSLTSRPGDTYVLNWD